MARKRTIRDLALDGKRILLRVDFNVPLDALGAITDDGRIRAALPTIRHCLAQGASAIVMSHLGRPKGDPAKDAPFCMRRVADRLRELLAGPAVEVCDEVIGPTCERMARSLKPGQVLVLENLRFHPGEKKGDPAFARALASLADAYGNDAFGTCHRSDASMVAVPKEFPPESRAIGLLVERELEVLDSLLASPRRPLVAVLGGAKVSDKIGFVQALVARVDRLLIGGAMTYTFRLARGESVGSSLVEGNKLELARNILAQAGDKLTLPVDHQIAERPDSTAATKVATEIPPSWFGMDIGPATIAAYQKEIAAAGTVLWNGPMGKFEDEPFAQGTRAIALAMAASPAATIVGGGESAEAVHQFGLADRMTHVSTGGGAFLEYVEGKPFAALAIIPDA